MIPSANNSEWVCNCVIYELSNITSLHFVFSGTPIIALSNIANDYIFLIATEAQSGEILCKCHASRGSRMERLCPHRVRMGPSILAASYSSGRHKEQRAVELDRDQKFEFYFSQFCPFPLFRRSHHIDRINGRALFSI